MDSEGAIQDPTVMVNGWLYVFAESEYYDSIPDGYNLFGQVAAQDNNTLPTQELPARFRDARWVWECRFDRDWEPPRGLWVLPARGSAQRERFEAGFLAALPPPRRAFAAKGSLRQCR